MDFFLVFISATFILSFVFDVDEPFFPALFIVFIISSLGDSDSGKQIDTTKGKPAIVTEEKINTASQKKTLKRLDEDETRVEWQDDNTKWNYNKGQTWETQKNF